MPLETGTLLNNRYRIIEQLATGGMGAVYVALDDTLQIKVAVKENLNLNPDSERQFRREASLLASLRHPNLPRVTDYFILEGSQYLVMDFIAGDDLEYRINNQPPSAREVLLWADGICDALSYLHSRQPPIIHRDIKPANIKVQPDGVPILVDFGIAKFFDDASKTTTGARALTPGFSPPEQYGGRHTDHRSDQYALAATFYNLLTCQRPPDSMTRLIKHVPLKPARKMNPMVPPGLDDAIQRALSLEPEQRFPDIDSFKAALHGPPASATIRSEQAAQTIPSEQTVPAAAPSRRIPIWIILGALAIILFGGGAIVLGSGLLQPEPAPTDTIPLVAVAATETTSPPPTYTPVPTFTQTSSPSATPTLQPTATAAFPSIGGGGRIAFISNRDDGHTLQVYTMNPDGSDVRQITFGPGQKSQPKWSPDGAKIAFVSNQEGNKEIYVMNADGSNPHNITNNSADEFDPAWMPDQTRLVFTSDRISQLRQVFIMDIDCESGETCATGKPRNLSAGFAVEYSPAWAPPGMQPLPWLPEDYTLAVVVSINEAPGKVFFRIPDESLPPEEVDPIDMDRSNKIVGVDNIAWSPDGQFITFTWIQPTWNEVYLIRLADRGQYSPVRLTNSLGNKEPAFSPDGQLVAFTSTRDQNPEIYLMSVAGAAQTNLTNNSGRDMQPDWQPAQ